MGDNDPRSYDYERIYNKPKLLNKCVLKNITIFILLIIMLMAIFRLVNIKNSVQLQLLSIYVVLYILINIKKIVIFIIKLYQNIAPKSLRSKCRFEPSCSNYMLMAIEKYGFIKGLKIGIKRIKRCNIDNGGYDYP